MEFSRTASMDLAVGSFTETEFLNVNELDQPKQVESLIYLWNKMFSKQASEKLLNLHKTLLDLVKGKPGEHIQEPIDDLIKATDDNFLYLVTRELHIKIHLDEIDSQTRAVTVPRSQIKKKESDLLDSQLILQSFLDYLRQQGPDDFARFVNISILRLVSTVHPNETERNTNLMHYTTLQEKYIEWKKDFDSISSLQRAAPEYRIRRETLNQLRRELKAEIEGLWQSDQMRRDQINVQNEAKRITERYKVIFKALPTFVKFIKKLAIEAFWRFQASEYYVKSPEWKETFLKTYRPQGNIRESKLKAIKRTFLKLNLNLAPPRIAVPVVEFGTWKGGDRDGNPFVVASFTNQTFIEQKEFVLSQYVDQAKHLVDKLTPSTNHIVISDKLKVSLNKDHKLFPYIRDIKPQEPYRAKMRYILEKLENSLARVREVKKQAGETTKPLLGLTLPGPTGYNNANELQHDIDVIYESLLHNEGKAQARSQLQDLHILVDTFRLHMTSIDFRQTSDKNQLAVKEFLGAIGHPLAATLFKMKEPERLQALVELLQASDIEATPWTLNALSKVSRDTFETFIIFADAAKVDPKAVGKFIISMCQHASDLLNVLFLMKVNGMLECSQGLITYCPFDVTGLFETIEDLKCAPQVVRSFLSVPLIRDYIINQRESKLTVMLGYSDSVRDGSSFASDGQIANTTIELMSLEAELNKNSDHKINLVFYRGRGDTLPRGYGGSIEKALMSQIITTPQENHTEQNRYLRRYATFSSALDHFHRFYSAHLSSQLKPKHPDTDIFLAYFDFFGKLSQTKWVRLVRDDIPEGTGKVYFDILNKYSILPHLPRSNFASRPVARDGITYNIDSIRAIPFTMALAQMREFTNAYYGTGYAFEVGSNILGNISNTALALLGEYVSTAPSADSIKQSLLGGNSKVLPNVVSLIRMAFKEEVTSEESVSALIEKSKMARPSAITSILPSYISVERGLEVVALLCIDLQQRAKTPLELLQLMYQCFVPFRFSLQNKETALIIRDKSIVDDYTKDASPVEKAVLEDTEQEGKLSEKWILRIMNQDLLEAKTMTQNFHSPELLLLHKIQAHLMKQHRILQNSIKSCEDQKQIKIYQAETQKLNIYVQMSILAISEALGFGG